MGGQNTTAAAAWLRASVASGDVDDYTGRSSTVSIK